MTGYAMDHPLVHDYLRRIDAATAHLTVDEGNDVRQGIRDHLAEALATARSDADVRNVLDALGQPEEIVDAPPAQPGGPWQPYAAAPPPASGRGAQEIIAVILLLIGGFVVPIAGWIIGVVLLWMSKSWTTRQKLLGTFVVPGGLGAAFLVFPLFVFLLPSQGCTSSSLSQVERGGGHVVSEMCSGVGLSEWLIWAGLAVVVIAPVIVGIYLLRAAGKPAAAPVPPGAGSVYSR